MKKARIFATTLLVVTALLTLAFMSVFTQNASAYVQDSLQESSSAADSFFSDKQVESSGYLYNFDGLVDYIYADFTGSTGYAIFAEESMELLEYATVGDFPYSLSNGELVYGGPRAYFSRSADQFVNIMTNQQFALTSIEIENLAQFTRKNLKCRQSLQMAALC